MKPAHPPLRRGPYPTLGLIGGAGPLACAEAARACLRAAGLVAHAQQDSEYPPMVVLNSALPGVGAGGIEDVDAASLALARAGNLAAVAGADFLLLACGSLHALLEGPHAIIPAVPVANWIERQAVSIGRSCKTVGIIGSRSARQTRVLARAVERQGAKAVNLDEVAQAEIDNIILHLMGGHCDAWAAQRLDKLSGQLVKGGCDGVWWGCTELALVPSHLRPANYRVFDPLRGMVDTALHAWGLQ